MSSQADGHIYMNAPKSVHKLPKSRPRGIQDQLTDLQEKELSLEKTRTELWVQAEFQRHQKELAKVKEAWKDEVAEEKARVYTEIEAER